MKTPPKITVIGDGWSGRLLAAALKRHGQDCELWLSENKTFPPPDTIPLFIGNGETADSARKIFGADLQRELWALSQRNWEIAQSTFQTLGVRALADGLLRADGTREAGMSFSAEALESKLDRRVSVAGRFRRLAGVTAHGNLDFGARLETATGTVDLHTPLLVVASDSFSLNAIPWLADKRIPVTLSSFRVTKADVRPRDGGATIRMFHSGAELAVEGERDWRFASVRNLWADRGVGVNDTVDSVTESNLRAYFSQAGWFASDVAMQAELSVESVTCDGLPIIGPWPGQTGIVFAFGFGARTANFIFAVAEDLATALTGEKVEALDRFSTRRLV